MNNKTTILLADDDTVLSSMLARYFDTEGYRVLVAENGEQALATIAQEAVDLLVLDVMMPGIDGIETLKRLRQKMQLPVIMLTARGDDLDRILGLELGADDYVAKPCNPRELLARIKAVLRRIEPRVENASPLSLGDLYLDPRAREVSVNGFAVHLTQTEFDLLHLLALTPGQVVDKQTISSKVLGKPLSQWDRSIDVHISSLRKKLGHEVDGMERIRTIRGIGYIYAFPESGER